MTQAQLIPWWRQQMQQLAAVAARYARGEAPRAQLDGLLATACAAYSGLYLFKSYFPGLMLIK